MNVKERADAIGTFRFIEVRLMETLAGWTPLTPEMEIKVMFGRHIFDFAQHADWLGKRTFELRKPEHYSRTPADAYLSLLDDLRGIGGSAERLAQVYDALLPALIRRYEQYLADTDRLLDGPSVLIIERIISGLRQQIEDAATLRRELAIQGAPVDDLRQRESQISSIIAA